MDGVRGAPRLRPADRAPGARRGRPGGPGGARAERLPRDALRPSPRVRPPLDRLGPRPGRPLAQPGARRARRPPRRLCRLGHPGDGGVSPAGRSADAAAEARLFGGPRRRPSARLGRGLHLARRALPDLARPGEGGRRLAAPRGRQPPRLSRRPVLARGRAVAGLAVLRLGQLRTGGRPVARPAGPQRLPGPRPGGAAGGRARRRRPPLLLAARRVAHGGGAGSPEPGSSRLRGGRPPSLETGLRLGRRLGAAPRRGPRGRRAGAPRCRPLSGARHPARPAHDAGVRAAPGGPRPRGRHGGAARGAARGRPGVERPGAPSSRAPRGATVGWSRPGARTAADRDREGGRPRRGRRRAPARPGGGRSGADGGRRGAVRAARPLPRRGLLPGQPRRRRG